MGRREVTLDWVVLAVLEGLWEGIPVGCRSGAALSPCG